MALLRSTVRPRYAPNYLSIHMRFRLRKFLYPLISAHTRRSRLIHPIRFEKKIYSQHGEDGVLLNFFKIIGTTNKYFVEFGTESGQECNTRVFWEKEGWKGLLMDGGHENPAINLKKEFITAENIVSLFQKYQVPQEFDLLSIDIDRNDFHVWAALMPHYRPRVVVIEYNATHLPFEDKVVKYDPLASGDGTNYFGASILAFYHLGKKYDYSLVYAEKSGTNLFFIHNEVLSELYRKKKRFKDLNNVNNLYRHPRYGRGPNGGHPKDTQQRSYLTSLEVICK